jgi:hypothetical protein
MEGRSLVTRVSIVCIHYWGLITTHRSGFSVRKKRRGR